MDIRCGKNAGARTCAVTFGYRDTELLKAETPDYIINNISDLYKIIKQNIDTNISQGV